MKKVCSLLLALILILSVFAYLPKSYAIFDINPTIRNGDVMIDGQNYGINRLATYNGAPYVPLNLVAPYIGMYHSSSNNKETFSYKRNTLVVDFDQKSVTVNNSPYTLLYGVSKKTVVEKTHVFISCKDIQNIFGILCAYDSEKQTIRMDTGFGVLEVGYSQEGGYQSESNMASAKVRLLNYSNNLATKIKGAVEIANYGNVSNVVDGVFSSINTPVTMAEFKSGVKVDGLSIENSTNDVLTYFDEAKLLSGFSNVTISPEYVNVYKVANKKQTMYVVGLFLSYEGLDVSNYDIADAAVATIEDTWSRTLSEQEAISIKNKMTDIANRARKNSSIVVFIINGNNISVATII